MSEVRKNILLLIPNLNFGGAQTSFSKLSVELGKAYNVTNVVFNKNLASDYSYGGPLLDLEVPASNFLIPKFINFLKRIRRLKKIKRQNKIDISISFLEGADYVNIFSGIGEKIIISIRGSKKHDQNISGFLGYIRHKWLIPYLYNRCNKIVVVNKGILEELTMHYKIDRPIQVIYNFYDQERIAKASKELVDPSFQILTEKFQVICIVGRLATEKGIDKFLAVFAEVKKEIKGSKLMLIGDGKLRESLVRQAQGLELTVANSFDQKADIIFAGYQANPFKFLSRCTVLALPSMHEGFPNILIEAMSLRVPVVASDCPYGPREILTNEAGLLLPVLSSSQAKSIWAEKLTSLLLNESERIKLAEAGAKRAADFSGSHAIEQWIDVIEK